MEIGAGAVLVADVITVACLCRVEFLRQLCRGINHRRKLLFLFCSLRRTYLRSPLCPAQHYVDITNKRQFAQVDEFKQRDCNGKRQSDLPWLLLLPDAKGKRGNNDSSEAALPQGEGDSGPVQLELR